MKPLGVSSKPDAIHKLGRFAGLLIVGAAYLAHSAPVFAQGDAPGATPGVQESASGGMEALLFYFFATITVGSGLAICLSRNIVRMAVYLFATLAAVALLYFLLLANFVGVIQLIVYAGGTLVLLIFGVMLTSKSPWVRFDVKRSELAIAGLVCGVLAAAMLTVVVKANWPVTEKASVEGSTVATMGTALLTQYLVPFEAISVLLLVVMIGAALLARQE